MLLICFCDWGVGRHTGGTANDGNVQNGSGFFFCFLLGAGLMSASARQIRHGETLRGGSEANLAPTSTVTSWKYKQGNNWCRIFQSCLRRRRVWRCLLHSPNRTLCYFQLFEWRHSLWSGRGLSVIRPN